MINLILCSFVTHTAQASSSGIGVGSAAAVLLANSLLLSWFVLIHCIAAPTQLNRLSVSILPEFTSFDFKPKLNALAIVVVVEPIAAINSVAITEKIITDISDFFNVLILYIEC